ncbi:MAG TPA: SpoIIE family protein phosphatase [Streptosporangiaceae bacterium]|nr:SpoIIE family protein phosphatase [Streptosporangiaceae bacterium]
MAEDNDLPPGWAEKLQDIQSITDAALSRLDPPEVLDALVGRVREALQADTAAVLLLDGPSGQLVATAASGLEEEVLQGARVPVGKGFAGRIAAEARPVIIDQVDRHNVVNPILLARGIRSLMGAPLLSGETVIGVLHVGTLDGRVFTSQDSDLLQLAADRAALAVQALSAQLDREAAAALQRSLVPAALPRVSGLEMAGRYVPGSGNVGGDWYDVFSVPSGHVYAVIGDVAGSGLPAAVIMGRIRSALRAYALESTDPAEVLSRLDRKLQHFEPDAMATVLCAVLSPSLDEVRISSAGHLPPIVAVPGQPAAVAAIAGDALLGLAEHAPRQLTTLSFPPGAMLCLYTDGLVERRGQPIDEGIARLRAALTADEPEAAAAAAMAAMAGAVPHHDDVALLLLRRPHCAARAEQPGSPAPGDLAGTGPELQVAWSGRHAVIAMPDEIDAANSAGVAGQLSAVIGRSPDVLTADLTGTVFCDSTGIRALARACERAAAAGIQMRLAVGDSPVTRMLQLTGLGRRMPPYRDARHSLATPRDQPGTAPGPPA